MNRLFCSIITFCVVLATFWTASEGATPVQDPNSGNNLYQIVNEMMGTSFTSSQDPALTNLEVIADDYWHEWDGYISIVATYAGYDQNIYWENDDGTEGFVHAAALDGIHYYETNPITFQTTGGDFWFKDMTSGGTWHTREDVNSDGKKHIITYSFGDGVFICAVEDLNGLGDQDYNDLVFKLAYGAAPINVPSISYIPDQAVSSGYPFPDLNLAAYVRDDDSSVTWTTSGETDLTITINQTTGIASISYTSGWTGSEDITFAATDEMGFYEAETVNFTVTVPEAPVVYDIPDQVIDSGQQFAPIQLDDYVDHPAPNITDEDIVWTTSGGNKISVTIDGNRVAHITYPRGALGSETINFTATVNPSSSNPATFTVLASSDPGVGGWVDPTSKLDLLTPYFGAALILGISFIMFALRRRRNNKGDGLS